MFGVDSSELAVVAILALIFIGPKDLPRVMRTVGYWVGRVRGMARHFTAGMRASFDRLLSENDRPLLAQPPLLLSALNHRRPGPPPPHSRSRPFETRSGRS